MNIEPLNNDHRRDLGIALGLAAALNYLRDRTEPFERLPGYNTAIALIEMLEAQHRAHVAGMNFRAAAAAGIDIRCHMIGLKGRGEIYADPMDLEQRAEFAASGIETEGHDAEERHGAEHESPTRQGDAQ